MSSRETCALRRHSSPDLHTWWSTIPLRSNNRRGIFDHLDDSADDLVAILDDSFEETSLEVVGSVAIFSAAGPRPRGRDVLP